MTTPRRQPRPVGPPPPPGREGPPTGQTYQYGPGPSGPDGAAGPPPGHPYVRVYRWTPSDRPIPWLAVLLLVLGIGLLIEWAIPELSFGSIVILAAGLAFGAAWLFGRVVGATMPALILVAWGLASIGRDFDVLTGDGWNTLFIGIAFLVGWGLGRFQHLRREWALWMGLVLGIVGLADVSETLPFDVSVAVVIPLAMIGVGLYLIFRDRLPGRR